MEGRAQMSTGRVGGVRTAPPLRRGRALAVSGVSVSLAAAGHWWASGVLPGALPVVACLLALTCAARRMTWREWTAAEIFMLLVAADGVSHVVFALAGSMGGGHGASRAVLVAAHLGSMPVASPWLMLVAHLGMSGLAAMLLRRGEATLWRIARRAALMRVRLAEILGVPSPLPSPASLSHVVAPSFDVLLVRHRRLACAAARRGPPLCSCTP